MGDAVIHYIIICPIRTFGTVIEATSISIAAPTKTPALVLVHPTVVDVDAVLVSLNESTSLALLVWNNVVKPLPTPMIEVPLLVSPEAPAITSDVVAGVELRVILNGEPEPACAPDA